MAEMGILGDGLMRAGTNVSESREGKKAKFAEYDMARKSLRDALEDVDDPADLEGNAG